jgi:hypothetical protein
MRKEIIEEIEHSDINSATKARLIDAVASCNYEYELCRVLFGVAMNNIQRAEFLEDEMLKIEQNREVPRKILAENLIFIK